MDTQRELLAAAIDIRHWLAADSSLPGEQRLSRDRAIGHEIPADGSKMDRVLAWWNALDAPDKEGRGARLAALVGATHGLLVIGGVVTGLVVAGATFAYRGQHPVNLFVLLGVLVAIPLVMLAIQVVFIRGNVPLPASIKDALAVMSPSRWAGTWLQRRLDLPLFESIHRNAIAPGFARWQLLAFSQAFAMGFFVGVLVLAVLLVVFTDLAFGWSTTLDVKSQVALEMFRVIALPWASILPAAVPDASLVEASRFYRLDEVAITPGEAARLGAWWPFVMMTILFYGLVPRIAFAMIAARQLRRQTRRLLEEGPEIAALLDRLTAPRVDFDGPGEVAGPADGGETLPALGLEFGSAVVVWNDAIGTPQLDELVRRHGGPEPQRIDVAESLGADGQSESLQDLPDDDRVLVLTKGWEPPLLAFNDFLVRLRQHIGPGSSIVVVPLNAARAGVNEDDRLVWSKALARCDDPSLYVAGASE